MRPDSRSGSGRPPLRGWRSRRPGRALRRPRRSAPDTSARAHPEACRAMCFAPSWAGVVAERARGVEHRPREPVRDAAQPQRHRFGPRSPPAAPPPPSGTRRPAREATRRRQPSATMSAPVHPGAGTVPSPCPNTVKAAVSGTTAAMRARTLAAPREHTVSAAARPVPAGASTHVRAGARSPRVFKGHRTVQAEQPAGRRSVPRQAPASRPRTGRGR